MRTPAKQVAKQINELKENRRFSVRSKQLPTWCPGCGYFGIHQGIGDAIQNLGLKLHEVVTISGIGCAGRYPFFSSTYGMHTTHGRTLPVATGLKLGNPALTCICVGGDGDGLGIGGAHLPHAARRDIDITYVLFDNSIYGLTKGQPSPSSQIGLKTKASPQGNAFKPIDATLMALAYGAGFLARCFAGDPVGITQAMTQAIQHPGFAMLHVYSTCLTFDKQYKTWPNLHEWVHPLPEGYDPTDRGAAMVHVLEDKFSMGLIYREEKA